MYSYIDRTEYTMRDNTLKNTSEMLEVARNALNVFGRPQTQPSMLALTILPTSLLLWDPPPLPVLSLTSSFLVVVNLSPID